MDTEHREIEMDSSYENQKIVDVEIDKEIKKSFIQYAMSVIVARALPDVRDGLKPVHRRILYAMYEDGLTHTKAYRKSATTVGNVIGRYHPHGDVAIYDSMVRMAQHFSLRYPLIDGQGNFGNVDGDPAAAYRYTEARMDRIAEEMMTDIERDVVDFVPNYDSRLKEPDVLPSKFPNLLVNGSMGIAVGMATNIPPHNLSEVIDGILAAIDNPEITVIELMRYIKGPDFPTYATIYGTAGIVEGYMTGRGRVIVRAKAEIEEYKKTHRIIVTEIPYQVNKSNLIIAIADLVNDKRIEGISDIRDESGRNGMKIVIDLKRDANPNVILNQLYKFTQLQDTYAMNMIALVNGEPKTLNLKHLVEHYIKHQLEILSRRIKYDLEKARQRAHIYEGLEVAIDNIDEVIAIIRGKKTIAESKQALTERFGFSDAQSQAIVELPLGRLAGLELEKIIEELERLKDLIVELGEILDSEERSKQIVKEELLEIKRKYGDERRTEILENEDEIILEDLIDREDCIVTMTEAGYIKRQPASVYQSQRRGGKGINAMGTKEDDIVTDMFAANSHDILLMFTNKGKVYTKKGYEIPSTSRISKGMNIVNLLELDVAEGEKVTTIIPVSEINEKCYFVMVTKKGVIKRTSLTEYTRVNRNGKIAITLDDGDELAYVMKTNGNDEIIIAATSGNALKFREAAVRSTGRNARGVRGIRLTENAYVSGVTVIHSDSEPSVSDEAEEAAISEADIDVESEMNLEEMNAIDTDDADADESEENNEENDESVVTVDNTKPTLLTVTKNGFGKRCEFEKFTTRSRGGKGMICHKIGEKTGELIGVLSVLETDDIMIITDDGTIIRTPVSGIPVYVNRGAGGVKVMRLNEGVSIKSFVRVEKEAVEAEEDVGDVEIDNADNSAE